MIIGIDIRPMAGLRTGIQEYTEQLLTHLIPLAPEHEFKLFFSSLKAKAPDLPWLHVPNIQLMEFNIPNNLLFFMGNVWGYPQIDKLIGGVDVFFSPHFFIAPLSSKCRRVTTFHDLSYLRFPEFFTWRKRWWHTVEMDPARQAHYSDRVITVSESTKSDLIEYYHIDPANISVVPSGTNLSRPADTEINQFKKINNLPERYIVYVGTLEPRKNVTGLIRAFRILKERGGYEDIELIIIGKKGWQFEDTLREISTSPYRSSIRYLGHLVEDRALYYAGATVCACPSFFEGFGFPVLEAMACGTSVITSTNSSLPEVAADAALLIDPYNISDIAEALHIVLSDKTIRIRLVKKGLEQAQKFTWDRAARATLNILTQK